jgi:hypothetical protein
MPMGDGVVRSWWIEATDFCLLVVFMTLVAVITVASMIWILGEWDDA